MDEQQRPVSPDGRYEWDGSNWVPRAQAPDGPAAPADPYAQQNPYGQAPYGGGYPLAGQSPFGGDPGHGLAGFGQRLAAYLVDVAVLLPLVVLASITSAIGSTSDGGGALWGALTFVLYVALIGVGVWNIVLRQGKTGWSLGKQALGIRLVSDEGRQPIGPLKAFVRQIAHVLDQIPCYVGYLLPLFTAKKQTIADMVMKSVVVEQKKV